MTEGWTKQTLNAPLPFYGGGIKIAFKSEMQYLQIDFLNIRAKNSKKQNCGKIQHSKQIKIK